jgi:hypothetical protein
LGDKGIAYKQRLLAGEQLMDAEILCALRHHNSDRDIDR